MADGQGPFISPNELVQKEMAPKTHVYFWQTKKKKIKMPPAPRAGRWEGSEAKARKVCQEKFGAWRLWRLWEMLWEKLSSLGNGAGDF